MTTSYGWTAHLIIDDNINEDEQSFAVVAVIGDDVPLNFSCFQAMGQRNCYERYSVTQIRIRDNDGE